MEFRRVHIRSLKSFWRPRKKVFRCRFPIHQSDDKFLNLLFFRASRALKMSTFRKKTMCPMCLRLVSNLPQPMLQYRNKLHFHDTKQARGVRTKFALICTNRANFLSNENMFYQNILE